MKSCVKLYTEIVEDPDQGTLTLAERGVWSLFLALCGRIDDRDEDGNETGRLDTPERVAWYLRCGLGEIEGAVTSFVERGMVEERDGVLYLPHYGERQRRKPSDTPARIRERVQRYREAKRECNATVTPLKRPVTRSESDTDTDTDADAEACAPDSGDGTGELFRLVESAGILVSQAMADQYIAVLDDDAGGNMALLRAAFKEAADSGARPMPKWLRAVVQRCKRDGVMPGQWAGDRSNGGNGARASPSPPSIPEGELYNPLDPANIHK